MVLSKRFRFGQPRPAAEKDRPGGKTTCGDHKHQPTAETFYVSTEQDGARYIKSVFMRAVADCYKPKAIVSTAMILFIGYAVRLQDEGHVFTFYPFILPTDQFCSRIGLFGWLVKRTDKLTTLGPSSVQNQPPNKCNQTIFLPPPTAGNSPLLCLLDLSKCFDVIDHAMLLSKIQAYSSDPTCYLVFLPPWPMAILNPFVQLTGLGTTSFPSPFPIPWVFSKDPLLAHSCS